MTRWIGLHKSSVRKMCQVILTISFVLDNRTGLFTLPAFLIHSDTFSDTKDILPSS